MIGVLIAVKSEGVKREKIKRNERKLLKMKMERVKGIEPSSEPWQGPILPLNHTRESRNANNKNSYPAL